MRRTTSALALLAIAPLALAACTSKSTADAEAITVTATDSTCDISGNSAETGNTTFATPTTVPRSPSSTSSAPAIE